MHLEDEELRVAISATHRHILYNSNEMQRGYRRKTLWLFIWVSY